MNKSSISFFPLDISYKTLDSGKIEISLYGITPDRQKVKILDSFLPYFWIIPKKNVDLKKFLAKLKKTTYKIIDVKIKDKQYFCNKVKAIQLFANNLIDLRDIRSKIKEFKEIDKIREIDISVRKKYLIDRKITPYSLYKVEGKVQENEINKILYVIAKKIKQVSSDIIKDPKLLAFDIETLCIGSAPNYNEDPIIMCSFYGSNNFKKVITWKKTDLPNIKIVGGEEELIKEISRTIKEFDPSIIVGYGSDFFDFPYIRERAKKYKINLPLGWEGSEPITKLRSRRGTTKLKGLIHLDLSHFVRKVIGRSLEIERYDLNSVGKEMINLGKFLDLKERSINQLWNGTEKDLSDLVTYNLRDSEITFKIAQKILPTQFQLSKLTSSTLFNIDRMSYSQLVEQFLIKNASEFNQIVPSRPKKSNIKIRSAHTYVGGFVVKPKAGIYENIGSFDYRSLYPSIISAYNIGPNTLNCECCKKTAKKIKIEGDEFWFCEKKKGFFSTLIKDLVERRKRIKQILKVTKKTDDSYAELNSLSYALKTLGNSAYGYMGFSGARWYCLGCVKSITAIGREHISKVIKTSEKDFGLKVIYGDTDGAFILLKNDKQIKEFLKKINSKLPDPMELEYQGKYKRGIFLQKKSGSGGAKKRYALLSEKGDITMKGIEAIRGDWSPIAKKVQKEVIEIILKKKSVKKAADYVKAVIDKIKNRELEIYDFAIEATLTKNIKDYENKGPHVIAAEKARNKGYRIGQGFTVSYIVCTGSGKIGDRIKLTEDAKKQDYDINYYIDNQVLRAVYKIFELFDYSLEKLKSGQSSLTNW